MTSKDPKIIIRKYRRRSRLVMAATVLTVLALLTLSVPLLVKFLMVTLCFVLEIAVLARMMSRCADPLLNDDLDPQMYYTVTHGIGAHGTNGMTDITTAYYLYDYHAAYNLCLQKLHSTKSGLYTYQYKMYLARMYFDTAELDKLRGICNDFQAAFENKRHLSMIYGNLIRFYTVFCDGDYATCRDLYKKLMSEKLYHSNRLTKIQIDYAYAVACLKNGDTEEAVLYFERIVQEAPKLNFARIAEHYLDAVSREQSDRPPDRHCIQDNNYVPPRVEQQKSSLPKRIGMLAVLCVALIVIGVSLYQGRPQPPLEAIAVNDEVSQLLAMLPVNENGDAVCLYANAYDDLAVAYLDCTGHEQYQCKITCEGIDVGWVYTIQAADSDLKITCTVYEDEHDIPNTAYKTAAFTHKNTTQYFTVIALEEQSFWSYSAYLENMEQLQTMLNDIVLENT